ncbi:DUF2917 domain-containing protein [Acidovorax sp. FJL06]|uniref:DUF2917 domain-containing protein n=1 Tax=Acidovorax sp. FJL06 TaxID=2153365 RepID=UPI000F576261|nr:DUF2917 domain-containing protein [Acidovorax sp. FJL06]RQO80704.1 hypothetical protein DBV10_18300 [Acidovorax sp. FJL06]
MPARNVLESQQSVQAAVAGRPAAGCWKLAPGRALSLHPREPSVLEIAQGRVWLTLSGASPTPLPADLPADLPRGVADHMLQAGDRLAIAAGQHVVMEAWNPAGLPDGGVAFHWKGAAALANGQGAHVLRRGADWECGVVQPLRDLAQALAQGGRAVGQAGAQVLGATGRLALGIARFALFWIADLRERRPV